MKPLRLLMRVKNNKMVTYREMLGMTSKEAAEKISTSWPGLENMKRSPILRKASKSDDGGPDWSDAARTISEHLGESLEDIWPDEIRDLKMHATSVAVGVEDLRPALPKEVEVSQLSTRLGKTLASALTPREEWVLRSRAGMLKDYDNPERHEDIGKEFDVTAGRIRQIEAKAMRKLRHPKNADALKVFIDPDHEEGNLATCARCNRVLGYQKECFEGEICGGCNRIERKIEARAKQREMHERWRKEAGR